MKSMATNGMASSYFPPNFLLHMQQQQQPQSHDHDHHLPPPPPFLQEFTPSMLGKRPPMYGGGGDDHHQQVLNGNRKEGEEEAVSDDDDDGSSQAAGAGEKKRRLSVEQVRTLEKNFELGNKLEPERKAQLARVLGLQPRQVAIWFQNRRARWKTKQLERDYDALRRQLDAVKAENDALLSHNKKLQAEIIALKGREAGSDLINLNKETEASCSNRSENSSEINLDISRGTPATDSPMNPPQGSGMPFYSSIGRSTGVDIDQLLHNPPTATILPKIELGNGNANVHSATAVSDTTPNFSNLLCGGVDEAPPFWPWADHQHFH